MAKFMILYSSMAPATEVMSDATPEEVQASMQEWIQWREEASKTFKVEFGLPLQAIGKVTSGGLDASDSKISGYSIIEGESRDALMEQLKTHPHLKRPGASIDVLEMLPLPGVGA